MADSWKTRSPSAVWFDLSPTAVTLDVGRHGDQRQSFDQHKPYSLEQITQSASLPVSHSSLVLLRVIVIDSLEVYNTTNLPALLRIFETGDVKASHRKFDKLRQKRL